MGQAGPKGSLVDTIAISFILTISNIDGAPMDPGTLTHNFSKIAKKAGLIGRRFHDLRHTFANLMLMAGIHTKIVTEMLGH
jgi:integrase